jgi:hypothetical protein
MEELHREMRGIATGTSIAHAEQAPLGTVHRGDRLGHGNHGSGVRSKESLFDFDTMPRFLPYRFQQRLMQPNGVRWGWCA